MSSSLTTVLQGLKKVIFEKCLAQHLPHSKSSINVIYTLLMYLLLSRLGCQVSVGSDGLSGLRLHRALYLRWIKKYLWTNDPSRGILPATLAGWQDRNYLFQDKKTGWEMLNSCPVPLRKGEVKRRTSHSQCSPYLFTALNTIPTKVILTHI